VNLDHPTRLETDIDEALAAGDLDRAEALAARYLGASVSAGANGDGARSLGFRANYLGAQVALAAGRLSQTLDRLDGSLPAAARLPPELACRVWLLAGEAQVRLRRHDEARRSLHEAQQFAAILRANPLLRLRELRVRLWLGEVTRLGEELAACGLALASQGDEVNLALLRCEEGRAWDAAGDLSRAESCWLDAERRTRSLDADPVRADALMQLGRLANLRGHFQEALDRYHAALACAPPRPQNHD
jgi:tetratricopeptide (TPR) repeat protein